MPAVCDCTLSSGCLRAGPWLASSGPLVLPSLCFLFLCNESHTRNTVRSLKMWNNITYFHSSPAWLAAQKVLQQFKLADIGEGIAEYEVIKWYDSQLPEWPSTFMLPINSDDASGTQTRNILSSIGLVSCSITLTPCFTSVWM